MRLSEEPDASAAELGVTLIRAEGRPLAVPDYMPTLIQHLTRVADVHWCTTWRDRANGEIRTHLNIPCLPVVDDGTNDAGFAWKADAARPLVEIALNRGAEVFWIEDFRGSLPDIDPRARLIDTTVNGYLEPADLLGTVLEVTQTDTEL